MAAKKNKTNPATVIIFVLIIALAIAGSVFYRYYSSRIPSNDLSVVGNTAGNINNGGYFAESDGRVYFSNIYDGGAIYSMDPDEKNFVKLTNSSAKNICIGGDHMYYYMDTASGGTGLGYVVKTFGLYRTKTNGKETKCLDRDAAITIQLVGDYIYYQRYNNKDFTKIYKIKTDKTDMTLVSDDIINPACAYNGTIYFNGQGRDHYLYAMDTRNDTAYTIYEGNLWYPQYQDGYIYFMDVSSNYRICRYNMNSMQVEVLTNDRADSFNVGQYNIYYQKNDRTNPCLMRMNLDGSNPEVVAWGNYSDINLTSEYAYFREFSDDTNTYHTPVRGAIRVEGFWSAQTAAIENQ